MERSFKKEVQALRLSDGDTFHGEGILAVTKKSIVGTNVAADALSSLSSPGVIGGAMIILGEDYGEGASVIQERSYAYALKSSMWLLDPRPDLPSIVRTVKKG